jgi:putative lipoic acid-binding regulatory protein
MNNNEKTHPEVMKRPDGMIFPCVIDIKVFLNANLNNRELVQDVLLQTVNTENILGITSKESSKGKYESFSCKVNAISKDDMDSLFLKLSSHPEVVMVL